jgi:hypothetical protein
MLLYPFYVIGYFFILIIIYSQIFFTDKYTELLIFVDVLKCLFKLIFFFIYVFTSFLLSIGSLCNLFDQPAYISYDLTKYLK